MAAYFAGGGAGTDVQTGTDGLQTLYLMNPNYVGYADAAAAATAAPNMMLLNSAVGSLTPASFGHHQTATPAAQHFVGIPLQPPPSVYNLWGPATATTGGADMSPRQQGPGAGAPAVSAVLSLSSREAAPPVTVAAVPFAEGKYVMGASPPPPSQEHAVMSSRYLKAAQELLDEAVSVKGVEEASTAAELAKSAMAVKKKEDSEGGSSGAAEDGGGSKSGGGAAEMSTAERQELQMKKSKLVNMLDEVEQRYRQYQQQMQAVAAGFEVAAGAGAASTYTALALRTISRQFRCLRDAIAAQVRAAGRALGEDVGDGAGGGRSVGSRLRFIDHQLRQQRALQQLGMMQAGAGAGAWRPQRGLPERSVSVLRAWLFEHFLHPYPKDSDKIMLAKQTGLTRSQVSNWFINARVRLWKPMVEEMYLEETKGKDASAAAGDDNSGGGYRSNNDTDVSAGAPKHGEINNGMSSSPAAGAGATTSSSKAAPRVAGTGIGGGGSKVDAVHPSILELAGEEQAQASCFYGGGEFQHKLKKARADDEPAPAFHGSVDVAALQLQAHAAAAATRHGEAVSHRELLMKFMEAGSGGGVAAAPRDQQDDNDGDDVGVGGYSLFTPAPYAHFASDQYAFAGNGGGVSLTLGLPHGAAGDQTTSFLMGGSNAGGGVAATAYDMNMQSTKQSFAAQLMRDFVA